MSSGASSVPEEFAELEVCSLQSLITASPSLSEGKPAGCDLARILVVIVNETMELN